MLDIKQGVQISETELPNIVQRAIEAVVAIVSGIPHSRNPLNTDERTSGGIKRLRSPIWDIRSSELDAKRPYRKVPYCIDTYWNSGKLRGRVSLMRSGIYRAHKEYEASM
ncbi:hypothetical protein TNCV_2598051 [Trichonephila clavipes]|nr:hypothetical protein TNCV_2598051 [Trichonephila clavipes]